MLLLTLDVRLPMLMCPQILRGLSSMFQICLRFVRTVVLASSDVSMYPRAWSWQIWPPARWGFHTIFFMSWNKRRSWNNAGHCHPLVMLFSKQYPYTSKIYKELAFPAPWANLRNTWWIHIDYGHAAMYAGRKQVACTQRSRKGSLSSSFCRCDSRRCTVPRNATAKRVNCLCKVIFCFVQDFIQCRKWNGVSQVCSKHNFEEIPGWR